MNTAKCHAGQKPVGAMFKQVSKPLPIMTTLAYRSFRQLDGVELLSFQQSSMQFVHVSVWNAHAECEHLMIISIQMQDACHMTANVLRAKKRGLQHTLQLTEL